MIDWLREQTEAADPIWQWVFLVLAGAIPYVESYFGAAVGVVAGVNPGVAITAAVLGNIASMVLLVVFAERIRRWRKSDGTPLSSRQQKFKRSFDRYGVAGVSLLGQTLLPSQLTSMAMVAFGAEKRAVIGWQTASIILWGAAFGLLAVVGVGVLAS